AGGPAADRGGLVADLRAVAQPDREAVALAAAGRAQAAPARRGLAGGTGAGAGLPGPVHRGVASAAPLRRLARRRQTGAGAPLAMITDLGRQSSSGGRNEAGTMRYASAATPPGDAARHRHPDHRAGDCGLWAATG